MPTSLSGSVKPKLKRINPEVHLSPYSISEQWLNKKCKKGNRNGEGVSNNTLFLTVLHLPALSTLSIAKDCVGFT